MVEITLITVAGQVLLPMMLLGWLACGACCNRLEWLLKLTAVTAYLALTAVVGLWLLAPWYLPLGFAVLGIGAAWASWRGLERKSRLWHGRPRTALRLGSLVLATAFCSAVSGVALLGRIPPPGIAADVSFPLRQGVFLVANGGYSILINPHMKTLKRPGLQAYLGQGYALDIVELNSFGMRASGLWPQDLTRYEIFAEPVLAPCDGSVIRAESRLPDLIPPNQDRRNPAGNFVYLECRNTGILLAHLMAASVTVSAGETVEAGQLLGKVGNSGYSTEPHLHIHAQALSTAADFMRAEPLPLKFGGRTLARNSIIVGRE
jgi:hypothetical protein